MYVIVLKTNYLAYSNIYPAYNLFLSNIFSNCRICKKYDSSNCFLFSTNKKNIFTSFSCSVKNFQILRTKHVKMFPCPCFLFFRFFFSFLLHSITLKCLAQAISLFSKTCPRSILCKLKHSLFLCAMAHRKDELKHFFHIHIRSCLYLLKDFLFSASSIPKSILNKCDGSSLSAFALILHCKQCWNVLQQLHFHFDPNSYTIDNNLFLYVSWLDLESE